MRLMRWLRRPATPVGRHSRLPAPPLVPSAAATLALQAAGEALESEPYVAPLDDVLAGPAAEPQVTLGFSDGGSVVLGADDPRVRTFRAAAAAIVEQPRA